VPIQPCARCEEVFDERRRATRWHPPGYLEMDDFPEKIGRVSAADARLDKGDIPDYNGRTLMG